MYVAEVVFGEGKLGNEFGRNEGRRAKDMAAVLRD